MNEFLKKFVDAWKNPTPSTTPLGRLDKIDWTNLTASTLKVAGAAAAAAGVAYLGTRVTTIDWGTLAVFAVPVVHFVLAWVTTKFTDNTPKSE